jgi:hypothetical protein
MLTNNDYLDFQRILLAMVEVNPADGIILPSSKITYTQTNSLTSASPVSITVPTGETWEVLQIMTIVDTDANAANRVTDLTVTGHTIDTLSMTLIDTTGITLTANQAGGEFLSAGHSPNLWTNTNGTIAVVNDENPLPLLCPAGTAINLNYTNDQVGDVGEIQVWYKKLNITTE